MRGKCGSIDGEGDERVCSKIQAFSQTDVQYSQRARNATKHTIYLCMDIVRASWNTLHQYVASSLLTMH